MFIRISVQRRVLLDANAVVVVLGVAPRAQAARAQAEKNRSDQLAERGRVDRFELLLGAMLQVERVERGATKRTAFRRFEIINQPLNLGDVR